MRLKPLPSTEFMRRVKKLQSELQREAWMFLSVTAVSVNPLRHATLPVFGRSSIFRV